MFAHSYGSEIVARAVNLGMKVDEIIFLSAPIHQPHIDMCPKVTRVIDIRLRNDLVLLLARARQKFPNPSPANVISYKINRPFWSHSASHDPDVWQTENIASHVNL